MTDPIEPFVISAGDDQLADLKQRLSMTRWPDRETQGGHFAALEQPEVFVEEVRACFRQLR